MSFYNRANKCLRVYVCIVPNVHAGLCGIITVALCTCTCMLLDSNYYAMKAKLLTAVGSIEGNEQAVVV